MSNQESETLNGRFGSICNGVSVFAPPSEDAGAANRRSVSNLSLSKAKNGGSALAGGG